MTISAPIFHSAPIREPVVLAHFLPWFTAADPDAYALGPDEARGLILPSIEPWRHWRDSRGEYRRSHLYQPLWGEYDSRDPALIRRQITTALDYGIDGFIINLYGKNSVENVIGLHVLRELRRYNAEHPQRPFVYAISLDAQAQWPSEGKTPVSLEEDFRYLKDVWCGEAALRVDGRFVFLIFAYDRPCAEYRGAMTKVFGEDGFELLWPNRPEEVAATGGYPWVRPYHVEPDHRWFSPDDSGEQFIVNYCRKANENPQLRLLCGGVWPGFNDQLVKWAWAGNPNDPKLRPRIICRETSAGSTLDLTSGATAAYIQHHRSRDPQFHLPMPLIQVVTWNDWAETTQVEPSRDTGYRELEICKRYSDLMKRLTPQST